MKNKTKNRVEKERALASLNLKIKLHRLTYEEIASRLKNRNGRRATRAYVHGVASGTFYASLKRLLAINAAADEVIAEYEQNLRKYGQVK